MTSDLYFIDEAENDMGQCLVLKAPWSDVFIDVIRKENISVLRLTESMWWKGKDISFLEKLQDVGLRGVEVYAWDVKDVTPLQFAHQASYSCNRRSRHDVSSSSNCSSIWRYC